MRLDFNVLWLDDLPGNVKSSQDRFAITAKREGFKLNVQSALSFDQARQHLDEHVFRDNIDLVLVDYDLGAGTKGDVAVREIRNMMPYKDIIFYSSIDTVDLKNKILNQGVEGVFCAHREELADTIIGVFEALVKKVLDIDHCRGIVMGATSDIDQIIQDCLLALAPALKDEHRAAAIKYAVEKLDERLTRFQEVRASVAATSAIADLLKSYEAFTAADKLKLLRELLTLHFDNAHPQLRKMLGRYANDVPPKRNKLGHVKLVAKDARGLMRGGGEEVTPEELRNLRRLLIDYREQFEQLAVIVGVPLD